MKTEQLSIKTLPITIKVVKIGNSKMTKATFEQIEIGELRDDNFDRAIATIFASKYGLDLDINGHPKGEISLFIKSRGVLTVEYLNQIGCVLGYVNDEKKNCIWILYNDDGSIKRCKIDDYFYRAARDNFDQLFIAT